MTVDPVEFGKLIQALSTITTEVSTLRSEVSDIKRQITSGKGVIIGLLMAAGGVGALLGEGVRSIFK